MLYATLSNGQDISDWQISIHFLSYFKLDNSLTLSIVFVDCGKHTIIGHISLKMGETIRLDFQDVREENREEITTMLENHIQNMVIA